jgi:hypothetical protein
VNWASQRNDVDLEDRYIYKNATNSVSVDLDIIYFSRPRATLFLYTYRSVNVWKKEFGRKEKNVFQPSDSFRFGVGMNLCLAGFSASTERKFDDGFI